MLEAVLEIIRKLELERLISSQPACERDLVVAMIVQRLIAPVSKLATTRLWHSTTLAEESRAWPRPARMISTPPWIGWGSDRSASKRSWRRVTCAKAAWCSMTCRAVSTKDTGARWRSLVMIVMARKSWPIIVYGVMTNGEGCPVAVSVYAGNTGDPTTVAEQVEKLRERFGLERVVMVGDRGMLTQPQIEKLKLHPGLGWITALTSTAIRQLVEQGALQLSLLDEKNLAEISAPEYAGERLMVCHNPMLEEQRRRKRQALLEATEKSLQKISQEVARRKRKPLTVAAIGMKVGKVLGRYKMGKHFACSIGEGSFVWSRRAELIAQEEKLDGIYVLRTSEAVPTFGGRDRAQLQEPGGGGTGVSLSEGDRSVGAADTASHRRARAGAHLSMRVGLLRGVASASVLGRRCCSKMKSGGNSASIEIRFAPAGTLGLGAAQEALARDCRWSSRAQLRDALWQSWRAAPA